ncbi:hypothetical protein GXM36_07355 [Campylobacter jejuni]|nr:hypothetical protein [Campylobacter jejuni]
MLKAQEKEKYILILDKNDFNKYRKDCSFINNQENLAHKIAIGEFRIFIVVYKCRRKNKISIWKNKTSIKVEILFFYKP